MVCLTEIIIGIGTRNSALPVVTGLLIFVCSVVVYLLLKLKKTRSDLEGKYKQAGSENQDLHEKLAELKKQFELFEKEQTRVANYYKMLIESADDGISFYDKDGTLKFQILLSIQ